MNKQLLYDEIDMFCMRVGGNIGAKDLKFAADKGFDLGHLDLQIAKDALIKILVNCENGPYDPDNKKFERIKELASNAIGILNKDNV